MALSLAAAGGCRSEQNAVVQKPEDIQKQIEEIKNNPKMPPQAKAMAIQQLESRAGTTDGGAGRPAADRGK